MPAKWIPTNQRSPKTDDLSGVSDEVIVRTNSGVLIACVYVAKTGKYCSTCCDIPVDAADWQPILD